ncbi:MAG: DUF3987 domain-containing protein [Planctomycetota bacterium]
MKTPHSLASEALGESTEPHLAHAHARVAEVRRAHELGLVLTPARGKAAFRKGWNEEQPLELDQLVAYAQDFNLSLRCGPVSGVLVIDDDSEEQGAAELLSLPRTWTVRTGSGRHHYYFKWPDEPVPNRPSAFGLKVELRGDGMAVLYPGSVHPDTNRLYEWAPGLDPASIELAELPQAHLDGLRRPVTPARPPGAQRAEVPHGTSLRDRLLAEVRLATEGTRNSALNRAAFTLGGLVGRGDLDRGDAEDDLLDAAIQVGLPEREARATIASGLSKGIERPLARTGPARWKHPQDSTSNVNPHAQDRDADEPQTCAPDDHPGGEFGARPVDATGSEERPVPASTTAATADLPLAQDTDRKGKGKGKGKAKARVIQRPFPLHLLPADVHEFCEAVADARSVDVSMVAAAVLVGLGSAIGLSRSAWDSFSRWSEPPAIWAALVMRSGGRKSPVLEDVFRVHDRWQAELHEQFVALQEKYQDDLDVWDRAQKRTKKASAKSGDEEHVPRPRPPKLQHIYTTDATQEAMVAMLSETPRGLLVINDELAGFFGSMGRYGTGRTDADRAFWLSMFRATSSKIDRATKGTIYVKRGLASVVGGVQPAILARCFDEESFTSGLASRFLLIMPTLPVKQYRQGPSDQACERYEGLLTRLLGLPFASGFNAAGFPTQDTIRVPFSGACRDFLRVWIPRWSEEALESAEAVEAAMSKLEGYALRFALIFKTCREANGTARDIDPIEIADLESGAELARWFRDEAIRVYETLGRDVEPGADRKLAARVEKVRAMGGAVTIREWRQRNNRRNQEEAKSELDELVQAQLAEWVERARGSGGGAPTQECRLVTAGPEGPGGEPGEVRGKIDLDQDTLKAHEGAVSVEPTVDETSHECSHNAAVGTGPGEVPLCIDIADRASHGDSGNGDRNAHCGEVPCCVLRGADAFMHNTPSPGPRNGGGPLEEGVDGVDLQHGTSPVPEVNSVGSKSVRANDDCTTQHATRNLPAATPGPLASSSVPAEARPTASPEGTHPSSIDPIFDLIRSELPGWSLARDAVTVVPIERVFNLAAEVLKSCYACGSRRFWRLADAGRGAPGEYRCSTCAPSTKADSLIERLDLDGGEA